MRQLAVVVGCATLVVACGGSGVAGGTGGTTGSDGTGGGSSSGDCPNLSGTWVITAHCEASFLGQSSTVTQTGCSYMVSTEGYTCSGTVNGDGSVTQTCDVDGTLECAGQLSEPTLTMFCGDCAVALERM